MIVCVQVGNAKKPDQREGRGEEAYKQCVAYLQNNSKNPDSFATNGQYTVKLANWATAYRAGKHQIIIELVARGMNSYGAVYNHGYTCWVQCAPDQPCGVYGTQEN